MVHLGVDCNRSIGCFEATVAARGLFDRLWNVVDPHHTWDAASVGHALVVERRQKGVLQGWCGKDVSDGASWVDRFREGEGKREMEREREREYHRERRRGALPRGCS